MNDNETSLLEEFEKIKADLSLWGAYVDYCLKTKVLTELAETHMVKLSPIFRLKSDKSYLGKALYRHVFYNNPLLEIQDKIATRVVLLKSDQVERAATLILGFDGWDSYTTKDPKGEIEDQPKIFDYQSWHVVVKPNDKWNESQIDKSLLTCEIQIRTLLQHAFAEISHDSTYKGVYRNDFEILRHLSKSMALMESTDDYFCKIYELMGNEQRELMIFTNELVKLFKSFNSTFSKSELNYDLTNKIFVLFNKQKVDLSQLERFIISHKSDLQRAIRPKNGLLFEQPVILLIAYYLFNHNSLLKENWPLNKESLVNVFESFNFSYERY